MLTVYYYTTIQSSHLRISCHHAFRNTSYHLLTVLQCTRVFFVYLIYRPDCEHILAQVTVRLAFAKRRAIHSRRQTAAVLSPTWCIGCISTCHVLHQCMGFNRLTRSYWRCGTSRHLASEVKQSHVCLVAYSDPLLSIAWLGYGHVSNTERDYHMLGAVT